MKELSTVIISHGKYIPFVKEDNTSLHIPKNIRLFEYDFQYMDYDNYYLLRVYNKSPKILFFIHKTTGKIYKKEFLAKEFAPNEIYDDNNIMLSFNNIQHMVKIPSLIIHPDGNTQHFHNNGIRDSFVISMEKLLNQLSTQYTKTFPNQVVEVHISSHTKGKWNNQHHEKKIQCIDRDEQFTIEEKQNMQNILMNDFIVVDEYPQAKYVSELIHEKTPLKSVIDKTKMHFTHKPFSKMNLKTYVHKSAHKKKRSSKRNARH